VIEDEYDDDFEQDDIREELPDPVMDSIGKSDNAGGSKGV
jgi:hypothetical protein